MPVAAARDVDLPKILTMCERFHAESYFNFLSYDGGVMLQTVLKLMSSPKGAVYVAKDDKGIVCGAVLGYVNQYFFNGESQVSELMVYVDEEHRGGMYGPGLIKQLIKFGKEQKVREVVLMAGSGVESERTEALYKALGFTKIGSCWRKRID